MSAYDANAPPSNESVTIRGAGMDLACQACGPADRPVLIFVHGYPDNHAVWDGVIDELGDDYRCVCYDVRGAGRSSRPIATRAYTLDLLEADLRAVIDWASPDAPVHLIAHDWGSIQTWEAVTDPALAARISSFTSISGPCLDHVGHWLRQQWRDDRAGLLAQLRKSWYVFAFHLPLLPALLWHGVLGRRWPAIAERLEGQALPVNPTRARDGAVGIRLYRANVFARLRRPRARHAQAPVLIITPLRDAFVGPGFADGLDAWVASLTVTRIDAAHWAIQTHPQAIAEHCRRLVEHHSAAAPIAAAQTAQAAPARPEA